MRLLNQRINFFIYCIPLVLILVVFVLFLLHYVSAKFRLCPSSGDLTATSDRNGESWNRIPSNFCPPSAAPRVPKWPVAQRMEALSLYGSRWALSEDSGFNSYPSRPEVYLVKNVVWYTTTMEGSNYWGYGYKTHHSYPRSRLNHLMKDRGEIWPKHIEEETTQKLPRWGPKVHKQYKK